MKKVIYFVVALLFCLQFHGELYGQESLEVRLKRIITLSKNGDYEGAFEVLEKIRGNLIKSIQIENIKTPMNIVRSGVCKQLTRGGRVIGFNPLPEPGELICFYVEIKNYTIISHDRGGYLSHLVAGGEITNKSGEVLLKVGKMDNFINNPVFKYKTLMAKYVKLPDDIEPGEYMVRFYVEDKLRKKRRVDGIVQFRIGKKGTNKPLMIIKTK
jgi:hypothetical protein